MIKHLTWLGDSIRIVFGAGAWSLDPIHADVVAAVIKALPEKTARLVWEQLSKPFYFDWMTSGRINVFRFYDEVGLPLLDDPSFQDILYKVKLTLDGQATTANVTFYKGRIFSVEFKKKRNDYVNKSYEILSVSLGSKNESFTRVIDRAEHGKNADAY